MNPGAYIFKNWRVLPVGFVADVFACLGWGAFRPVVPFAILAMSSRFAVNPHINSKLLRKYRFGSKNTVPRNEFLALFIKGGRAC
jgi:hypothetical protein